MRTYTQIALIAVVVLAIVYHAGAKCLPKSKPSFFIEQEYKAMVERQYDKHKIPQLRAMLQQRRK